MGNVYVKLERLEIPSTFSPYSPTREILTKEGRFLVERSDGSRSIGDVVYNGEDSVNYQEVFLRSENIYEENELIPKSQYDKDILELSRSHHQEILDLKNAYENRIKELELQAKYEQPKIEEHVEWVSGKTLLEIVKTLAPNNKKE